MSIGQLWRSERRKFRELIRSQPWKILCICIVGLQLLGVIYTMVLVASDGQDVHASDDGHPLERINLRSLTLQPTQPVVTNFLMHKRSISSNASSLFHGSLQQENRMHSKNDAMMAAEMEKRIKQLKDVCRRLSLLSRPRRGKPSPKAHAGEFLIDAEHHLIWCSIFKAGASTMMYNFNLLAGYTKEQIEELTSDGKTLLMTLARKKFPRPTGPELMRAIGDGSRDIVFLVVRHPFERLVSAYRDKFLHAHKGSHHDKLGLRLIAKYRSLEDKKAMHPHPIYGKKPTFHEFSLHVIDEARLLRFDMHWEPYYRFCSACQVGFNAVVKLETLEQDLGYIFRKSNVLHIVDSGRRENRGTGETKDYAEEYFGKLPPVLFQKLMIIYSPDLEMFGYSPEPFQKMLPAA